uniref:Methyltransferase domain-containing protein n=1 Tax=viral metagenome TaxID=1070528 RepID=A0A6C0AX13_9ZZZZ
MEDLIKSYYNENKIKLHKLFENIEILINGRICHSSIILLKILCDLEKIENYLEIGVHNGGSMSLLLTNNNSKNLFGIDLFEDMYNIDKHMNSEKYNKYQYFKRDNLSIDKTTNNLNHIKENFHNMSSISLIQGNSYYNETEEKFKNTCNFELDLLFIDGDHTLDGVQNDFERYNKYVKKNGYIIFDDYHHEIIKNYCDTLLTNNDNFEIITKFQSYNSNAIDLLVKKLA